jgi:hypothetical protein
MRPDGVGVLPAPLDDEPQATVAIGRGLHAEPSEPLLPSVEGLLADAELADDLGHRTARLSLPQSKRDLLFRKVLLSHPKNTPFLVMSKVKNLTSRMDQETGRTSSRLEILAACGLRDGVKMPPWQTGVYWAKPADADLLAFTLDKTSGGFSPTTRYRDYAVSRDLIHWESQSATRADTSTGQRYQYHWNQGSSIMLFARLNTDDRAFWFLGPATYLKHEGEQPMAITWQLKHPLPADLYTTFAAAVA